MKKVGLYLMIGGVALEFADRFLTPPHTNLSDTTSVASLQQQVVSINESLIPIPNIHLSYVAIAVGAFLYWR